VKIDRQAQEIELDQQRARRVKPRASASIARATDVKNIFTFE
jgi:hypothetical protein